MKYFKDPSTNQLYAYEADGSQDAFIPDSLVAITEEEADVLRADPPPPLPTTIELLAESDKYMSRASEDLIVSLLEKGSILKTDMQQIVWDRINYRRGLRNQPPV
jgi:hypothetical protein